MCLHRSGRSLGLLLVRGVNKLYNDHAVGSNTENVLEMRTASVVTRDGAGDVGGGCGRCGIKVSPALSLFAQGCLEGGSRLVAISGVRMQRTRCSLYFSVFGAYRTVWATETAGWVRSFKL